MTDRTERGGGPRGRKQAPRRPGQGGRPPRTEGPRPDRDTDARKPGPRSAGSAAGPRKPAGPFRKERDDDRKPSGGKEGKPASKRFGRRPPKSERAPSSTRTGRDNPAPSDRPFDRKGPKKPWGRPAAGGRPFRPSRARTSEDRAEDDGRIRLNRYLSNAGIASRRDADDLIKAGVVSVNGQIVTELGTKVGPNDKVVYGGQRLSRETKRYVLLNKPKDFLTTTDDPRDRRTVMALVEKACSERIYPVGRLDRNTTGLLLLTNDGDLAKRLTHPSFGAEKLYHVTLDKNVAKADLEKLVEGVELDDGPAKADEARFVDGSEKKEVGLKLHMGRNRVVRRMFEALGYEVVKLDRVMFAGLTKKDIPRGHWRHLKESEVLFLTKRKKASA